MFCLLMKPCGGFCPLMKPSRSPVGLWNSHGALWGVFTACVVPLKGFEVLHAAREFVSLKRRVRDTNLMVPCPPLLLVLDAVFPVAQTC